MTVAYRPQNVVLDEALLPKHVCAAAVGVALASEADLVRSAVVEHHAVAVAIDGDVGAARACGKETVCPCVGRDIDHRVGIGRDIV